MTECQICAVTKKSVFACPYCSYHACTMCYERIFLDSINEPACVSCKREFMSDFLHATFTKAFLLKRYAEHRQQVLYDREKALLPATQVAAERARERIAIEKRWREAQDKLTATRRLVKDLTMRTNQLRWELNRLEMTDNAKMDDVKSSEKSAYVAPCPNNDCRGFLTSSYVCGLCKVRACRDCREVLSVESVESKESKVDHECNPDTVESVKEIAKSTRSCPNCHTPIFKISGCDQMWCVQCNVAFSWSTGQIQQGPIHNPHYFEYMSSRNNGQVPRNPQEVRCGGLPPVSWLSDIQGRVCGKESVSCRQYISTLYREIVHLREVILRGLPTALDNICNRDLRIDYLLGDINEDEFKTKLQRREKDRAKKLEQRAILEMYCNVVQDCMNNYYQNGSTFKLYRTEWSEDKANDLIREELEVRKYMRDAWERMNHKYNSSVSCPLTL